MTKPTIFQDTSKATPSSATIPQPQSSSTFTMDLKHIPLIMGLLVGAGGGGSLGTYFSSSDQQGIAKIELRLTAIDATLQSIKNNNMSNDFEMRGFKEKLEDNIHEDAEMHKKLVDRVSSMERSNLVGHTKFDALLKEISSRMDHLESKQSYRRKKKKR